MGLVSAEGSVFRALATLDQLELLRRGPAAVFLTGDSLTVADLASWRVCGWLSCGILDGVPIDFVPTSFLLLMEHHRRISGMPDVQEWMRSHPTNYNQ